MAHSSAEVVVIDYGMGNVGSVANMIKKVNGKAIISGDPEVVSRARKLVLPGVGAFDNGMTLLHKRGLVEVLNHKVLTERVPLLGICLGMQLLFEEQEEGNTHGLGLLPGRVRALEHHVKAPQIGWNRVHWMREGLGYHAGDEADYYFVHSYVVEPTDLADAAALTRYGHVFSSVVHHGQIWGTEFHPEKSGPAGLSLIAGWIGDVLSAPEDAAARERVRGQVRELCRQFPAPANA